MHELPLHPLTITAWMIADIDHAVLPLAEAGGEMLEKVKEPGFAQWVVYLLVAIYVAEKVGGLAMRLTGRESPQKREITGTVVSREAVEHATTAELAELREAVDNLRDEAQSANMAALRAGEQRVSALSEVVDSETSELEAKMDKIQERLLARIDEGFRKLGDQLGAVAIQAARHDEALPHLSERITALTDRYNEAIPALHRRIDDAMKRPGR